MSFSSDFVFVAYDDMQSLDLTGPWEVLEKAAVYAGSPASLVLATPGGRDVRTNSGLKISADAAVEDVEPGRTLVIVGGDGVAQAVRRPEIVAAVRRLADAAERTTSVCSGAFLLGAAGLLEGRRATTHWTVCDTLAENFPATTVEPDSIYVRDGDVWTSAGVTSGIDLALALAEEDHGREVALRVARQLVVYSRRPGGQKQFSVQLERQTAEREPLRELQAWMSEHVDDDLSVGALAARMHVSERHFSRMFRAELGVAPGEYAEQLRVERARALLETDGDDLASVASRSGFHSAEVMRRAFHRIVGTTPREYRERFRTPLRV